METVTFSDQNFKECIALHTIKQNKELDSYVPPTNYLPRYYVIITEYTAHDAMHRTPRVFHNYGISAKSPVF